MLFVTTQKSLVFKGESKSDTPGVLCVDLDGTLILCDSTRVLLRLQIRNNLASLPSLILSSFMGRHAFKEKLSLTSRLTDADWKLNESLISFLDDAKRNGSEIYLVTGSSETIAEYFYEKVGIFTGYFSSKKDMSLKGRKKAQFLSELFPNTPLIYFGDALKDVWVWREFQSGVIVQKSKFKKNLISLVCILIVRGRIERF